MRLLKTAVCVLAVLSLTPAVADARYGAKKGIMGPIGGKDGRSMFPTYRDLGVGIFQYQLHWDLISPVAPRRGDDPSERTYEWPDELDFILREARRSRMKVAVTLVGTPAWANGGRDFRWAPSGTKTFAAFVKAASLRYPGVKLWVVGNENNSRFSFQPILPSDYNAPLTEAQRTAPRRYARLLDAAYGAIKSVDKADLVVGGNLVSSGSVSPRKYMAAMTVGDAGEPPRMDVFGYVPAGPREPSVDVLPPTGDGRADLAEVGTIVRWVDQYLTRSDQDSGSIPVFFTRWYIPSDHRNGAFDFFVSREDQARYITQAMAQARANDRIYGIGWEVFADEPARADGFENLGGLVDSSDQPKPSYFAFREG